MHRVRSIVCVALSVLGVIVMGACGTDTAAPGSSEGETVKVGSEGAPPGDDVAGEETIDSPLAKVPLPAPGTLTPSGDLALLSTVPRGQWPASSVTVPVAEWERLNTLVFVPADADSASWVAPQPAAGQFAVAATYAGAQIEVLAVSADSEAGRAAQAAAVQEAAPTTGADLEMSQRVVLSHFTADTYATLRKDIATAIAKEGSWGYAAYSPFSDKLQVIAPPAVAQKVAAQFPAADVYADLRGLQAITDAYQVQSPQVSLPFYIPGDGAVLTVGIQSQIDRVEVSGGHACPVWKAGKSDEAVVFFLPGIAYDPQKENFGEYATVGKEFTHGPWNEGGPVACGGKVWEHSAFVD